MIIHEEIQPIEITENQPVIENIIIPVKQASNKSNYKEEEYEELPTIISEKEEVEDGEVIGFEPQSSPPTTTQVGIIKLESGVIVEHYVKKVIRVVKKNNS